MARRKLNNREIRKLTKTGGNSYYVVLPIEAIRDLGWRKSQKLIVGIDKKKDRIIIKDWENETSYNNSKNRYRR